MQFSIDPVLRKQMKKRVKNASESVQSDSFGIEQKVKSSAKGLISTNGGRRNSS